MHRKQLTRMMLAAALAALLVIAFLLVQGCGGGAETGNGSEEVLPRSNATTPEDETDGNDSVATQTTPAPKDPNQSQPETSDRDKAIEAAKASATAGNPSIGALEVTGVKIVEPWARVDLVPADRSTDGASWLLKKTDGAWTVVDYGTSLIPADHPEAPSELFQ